jgi:hypothetical protein
LTGPAFFLTGQHTRRSLFLGITRTSDVQRIQARQHFCVLDRRRHVESLILCGFEKHTLRLSLRFASSREIAHVAVAVSQEWQRSAVCAYQDFNRLEQYFLVTAKLVRIQAYLPPDDSSSARASSTSGKNPDGGHDKAMLLLLDTLATGKEVPLDQVSMLHHYLELALVRDCVPQRASCLDLSCLQKMGYTGRGFANVLKRFPVLATVKALRLPDSFSEWTAVSPSHFKTLEFAHCPHAPVEFHSARALTLKRFDSGTHRVIADFKVPSFPSLCCLSTKSVQLPADCKAFFPRLTTLFVGKSEHDPSGRVTNETLRLIGQIALLLDLEIDGTDAVAIQTAYEALPLRQQDYYASLDVSVNPKEMSDLLSPSAWPLDVLVDTPRPHYARELRRFTPTTILPPLELRSSIKSQ